MAAAGRSRLSSDGCSRWAERLQAISILDQCDYATLHAAAMRAPREVEILFDDPRFVVADARSRWARRGDITLADGAGEPWILPPSLAVKDVLEKAFESNGLKAPSPVISASSILLRHKLFATGRFLSVLAISLLQTNAKR